MSMPCLILYYCSSFLFFSFFFFNDTATTEIYTLSLHDALPIWLGDAALNYRYQVRRADARVAIAPRLSMLVPTGNSARGLGSGHVGAQLNVPVSVILAPALVSHWNAGVTAVPHTTTYNLGASGIWLARPTFNVMVEVTWLEQGGAHDG